MQDVNEDGSMLLRKRIKELISLEYGSVADFYHHLYGERASKSKLQTFRNYLNRGKVGGEFLLLLSKKTSFGQASLAQLFDAELSSEDLFGKR